MIDELAFAFGITGPVLLLLIIGRALRATAIVDDHFVSRANALVFNVALPALLFFSIAGSPLGSAFDIRLTLVGLGGTLRFCAVTPRRTTGAAPKVRRPTLERRRTPRKQGSARA